MADGSDEVRKVAMASLMQAVSVAKFAILSAQDNAPKCLVGGELDGVGFTLTQMRSSLEQLDNRIQVYTVREAQRDG